MQFEIKALKELEDGGAELIIDMDDETQKYLVNFAILEIINRGLYEVRELHEVHDKKGEQDDNENQG